MSDADRLAERLIAERAERRRIAEQLHDGPVQHVAALSQMLDATVHAIEDGDQVAGARLASRALQVARDAAEELREIVSGLEPVALEKLGLEAAVRELAERAAARHGTTVEVSIDDEVLGEGARSSLFQVIRETLDQAFRRGPPQLVVISLTRTASGGVDLAVSDDGSPERRQAVLDGFAERAKELNGSFSSARDGDRTVIRLTLPPSAAQL